ncbi:hypothetical protein [Nostoc sp.]|uniref:hypothetical protein n=1 Tax=Nostoc sp. TaxID=1180 RepID=UPI002FF7F363
MALLEEITGTICKFLVALIVVPLTILFTSIPKYNLLKQIYTYSPKSLHLDSAIAWVLARAITLIPNYLSLLKKLEIGVFFFCWRSHREAKLLPTHYGNLPEQLKEQAISEYGHAQVFCQLTGSKLNMSGAGLMSREEKAAFDWGCVDWDTSGESYQVDGMSTKYLSAKMFFSFRTANSYGWRDRLAFMYVLEDFQSLFYTQLLKFVPVEVKDKLQSIVDDELNHAIQLYGSLFVISNGTRHVQSLLSCWQIRKYLALAFVPVDAFLLVFLGKKGKDWMPSLPDNYLEYSNNNIALHRYLITLYGIQSFNLMRGLDDLAARGQG